LFAGAFGFLGISVEFLAAPVAGAGNCANTGIAAMDDTQKVADSKWNFEATVFETTIF